MQVRVNSLLLKEADDGTAKEKFKELIKIMTTEFDKLADDEEKKQKQNQVQAAIGGGNLEES